MTTSHPIIPWRYAAIYAGAAALWIVASDFATQHWIASASVPSYFDTIKGLAFVLVTAAALFGLLQRVDRRLARFAEKSRRDEERWRRVLDAIGEGAWDWDLPTGRVYYSPRWCEILGLRPEDISARIEEWETRLHPADAARVRAALDQYLRGDAVIFASEYRLRDGAGNYRWVLDRGAVVERDAAGKPLRMVGTQQDVSVRKELEERIACQAERYRTLFEENPHPMWVQDVATGRILAVNDSAVRKYGYSQAEFLSKSVADLESVDAGTTQPDAAAAEAGRPMRHRLANGGVILVDVDVHDIPWEGRRACMVVAHDITAQTRALDAVEESEQKFSTIFHSANDAIFTADEHFVITDCNARGLELFRASRGDMVGHRIPEFFPEKQPDGSNSIARSRDILRRVWVGRYPPFEWTHKRPDGSCFISESTISSLSYRGRKSIVVVVRDLTERMKTTEQLRLLHAAIQAAPIGMMISDATGRIDWVNPAFSKMTGYRSDEVIGRNPRLLRSGNHKADFYRELWGTIGRGDVWAGEIQNRRKDGTLYHEHMTIAPVRAPDGVITHFVAMKYDITNERHLEQQLARAQRLESIGMLASGIAHDLNNVLTPIVLSVELLKTDFLSAAARTRLDLVAQSAQRGAGIVKQVLTFARGVEGERTAVQPRYLIKEMAQLAEETFPRNIEVRVESGRDVPTIVGDVTQLHQVLLNLAVNARDAMPAGGRLVLGARAALVDEARARRTPTLRPGPHIELSVSDTGSGMTDEVLEHLFEPFFTTKPRGKGTGLGLSTVYGIVRAHGGAIEVSTELGRGTSFRVLLPLPPGAVIVSGESAAAKPLRGTGRLVLVVDDEEPIRIIAEQVLKRNGFAVVVACDGVQALQLFRMRPQEFHVAIVDSMMPRMNGTALIRELRALRPELRVICSSGFMSDDSAEGNSTTFDGLAVRTLLPKPYGEMEMLEALRQELGE